MKRDDLKVGDNVVFDNATSLIHGTLRYVYDMQGYLTILDIDSFNIKIGVPDRDAYVIVHVERVAGVVTTLDV